MMGRPPEPACSGAARCSNRRLRRHLRAGSIGLSLRAQRSNLVDRAPKRVGISDFYIKDPTDPQWTDERGYQQWVAFMDRYYPEGDKTDLAMSMIRRMRRPSCRY